LIKKLKNERKEKKKEKDSPEVLPCSDAPPRATSVSRVSWSICVWPPVGWTTYRKMISHEAAAPRWMDGIHPVETKMTNQIKQIF
jgi:hypothetical protein